MRRWLRYVFLITLTLSLSCQEEEKETGMVKVPAGSPAVFKTHLPRPFFEKSGYLSEIYWISWNLLDNNVRAGTPGNGFSRTYLDEGFNEYIYQWDTCFMVMFAIYGHGAFPAMESLDNFYARQRRDGWICRVYHEGNGEPAEMPGVEEPMINPPLFAWAEWKYYLLSGDNSRFIRILPVLDAYYRWIDGNCRGEGKAQSFYYNTHLGSGMDDSPRFDIEQGGWVDLSCQMALFAKFMMFIARETGEERLFAAYQQRYNELVRLINSMMWDEGEGFYYDLDRNGRKQKVKTGASFWSLISETATFPQARKMAEHLSNPDEFYRPHLFPSLSADHPEYDREGHYWRGGVWAPLNYMIIKGLDMYPLREIAAMAAMNHVNNIYDVYANFRPDSNRIIPSERDVDYRTIWECYSPDFSRPATRWDGTYYCRQDFVGWTGLGPVALLLENIIGLQPSAPEDELYWNLRLQEKHGVENYRFGDNRADIICESNDLPAGEALIRILSDSPFRLVISSRIGRSDFDIVAGENRFVLML
ncbi:MAG: hypothetical protein EH225_07910 [Calditrichaeota bacterium]|nr:hypothetical protein [Calditrichota bacterium]RQW02874.1 MAG: hypothetical protein EH225_07910 [Calditrichota bacterium]